MGHPSNKVLQCLLPNLELNNEHCETCSFSKQTRLPFKQSMHESDECFNLIHSDVWGSPVKSF